MCMVVYVTTTIRGLISGMAKNKSVYVQHITVQHITVQHISVKHVYVQHITVQHISVQHITPEVSGVFFLKK